MLPRIRPARIAIGAGVAAATVVLAAAPAFAVTNGGFESPMAQSPFTPNTTVLDDWTVTPDIDHIGTYWQAAEGTQSIDLNGCQPGTISQVATTTPGAYSLLFALAGNPDQGTPVKTLTVTVTSGANVATQNLSFDTTGKTRLDMGWVTQQLDFTATGDSTITFTSTTPDCWGPALDDVRLVATPAPVVDEAPVAILLPASAAAIGGLAFFAVRRRRTRATRVG